LLDAQVSINARCRVDCRDEKISVVSELEDTLTRAYSLLTHQSTLVQRSSEMMFAIVVSLQCCQLLGAPAQGPTGAPPPDAAGGLLTF